MTTFARVAWAVTGMAWLFVLAALLGSVLALWVGAALDVIRGIRARRSAR